MKLEHSALLRQQSLVDGQWVGADSGATSIVYNPATGENIGTIPVMGGDEAYKAIAAAHKAFERFRHTTVKQRSDMLRAWADLLMNHIDDLALIMTTEQGKPLAESKGEITISAEYIRWFAEEGRRAYGEIIPSPLAQRRLMTIKQPIGVVAHITPWNFPMSMGARKLAPAIAAGCANVLKPAGVTPFSALALAFLAEEAGIPPGVINVITGKSSAIGSAMCESDIVKKISFTGSTEVGRVLYRQSADNIKKLSLELGGNAPFIVFDDADIDEAVQGAMAAKFRNAGQTCVCANRIFVQSGIYDAFVDGVVEQMKAIKVGSGTEKGVTQGPLIDRDAVEKVEQQIEDAVSKGGVVRLGGKRIDVDSCFFQPTVIANCSTDMLFFREETFGPLAPIIRFEDEDEVIRMANDTIYGLAGFFYSQNVGRCFRVAEALDFGQIGVNAGVITTVEAPFGGVKQSGIGREGGREGLDEYLESKYIAFDGLGI